ncbi:hypothetical protein PLICRDRAFT_88608 [Plicaturopsis crispa FD-325 SS-3]|nr:hypothetical protein PLICRDRAFT_88608 [Plicaturopsis crispa FD-325 SS-3]
MQASASTPNLAEDTADSPPPPTWMREDDYAAADGARARLHPKSRFSVSLSVPSLRARARSHAKLRSPEPQMREMGEAPDGQPPLSRSVVATNFINLDGSAIGSDEDLQSKDVYRWAMLYENQRGITLFSTRYYSALSLLPSDPSPFTLPSAVPTSRATQPELSFDEYPLPDGNWRWVSRAWMIDVRTDGSAQHDGFEYNWSFRTGGWRAQVGRAGAGGWVRRRRWVRLMMRPAGGVATRGGDGMQEYASTTGTESPASSRSIATATDSEYDGPDHAVWQGNGPDDDWTRCRRLMRRVGRDGRKLELWRQWLHPYFQEGDQGTRRSKQWTEDDELLQSERLATLAKSQSHQDALNASPPLAHMAAVLNTHGTELLHAFVYPESRAHLLDMFARAGILPELGVGLTAVGRSVDFWSYTSGLAEVSETQIGDEVDNERGQDGESGQTTPTGLSS